jgi:hypothetical protein
MFTAHRKRQFQNSWVVPDQVRDFGNNLSVYVICAGINRVPQRVTCLVIHLTAFATHQELGHENYRRLLIHSELAEGTRFSFRGSWLGIAAVGQGTFGIAAMTRSELPLPDPAATSLPSQREEHHLVLTSEIWLQLASCFPR